MEELIKTEDLKKIYMIGDVQIDALKGINLTINRGEFISIMGSSGSGKSTLMNIMGCLDTPSEGNYYFNGKNTSYLEQDEMSEIRNKKIGFVFQNFNLLNRISTLANVELPLIYNGTSSKNKSQQAKKALNTVGLADREGHLPTQLSGGQQQRVAIARAMVNNPDIILADEPTGNLDTNTGYEIIKLFEKLNTQGRTIVIITHERDIASFAKRVVHLKDGIIEKDTKTNTS